MPYYYCVHGPGAEEQMREQDSFPVDDHNGRRWYCRGIQRIDPKQPGPQEEAFESAHFAQKRGDKQGFLSFGGPAEDEDDLRDKLTALPDDK
jgi:hypothetical protein